MKLGLALLNIILLGMLVCMLCIQRQIQYNYNLQLSRLEQKLENQQKDLDFCKRTQSLMQSDLAKLGIYDKR